MVAAEHVQFTMPEVKQLLDQIGWLANDPCRDVMTMLAQHDFAFIPPPVESLVSGMFSWPNHTVIGERMFQGLEDSGRDTKNRRMSRVKRMYHPVSSTLLELFSLTDIDVMQEKSVDNLPRQLPASVFHVLGAKPSIDDDELSKIKTPGRCDFPITTAQGLQLEVPAWLALVRCHQLGNFELLGETWLALLFPETGVVREKASGRVYIVLATSQNGCLMWPADQHSESGRNAFFPSLATGTKGEWQVILGDGDWECIPVQPLPPRVARLLYGRVADLPFGVLVTQSGAAQSLWVSSAWHGFVGLADKYLDKTMRRFSMLEGIAKKSRPKGVLEKVEHMVNFFIPDIDGKGMASILKLRAAGSSRTKTSLLMKGENLEHTFGAMENDDAKAAKDYHATQTAQVSRRAQTMQWLKERKYMTDQEFAVEMRDLGLGSTDSAATTKQRAKGTAAPSLKAAWSWAEVLF